MLENKNNTIRNLIQANHLFETHLIHHLQSTEIPAENGTNNDPDLTKAALMTLREENEELKQAIAGLERELKHVRDDNAKLM